MKLVFAVFALVGIGNALKVLTHTTSDHADEANALQEILNSKKAAVEEEILKIERQQVARETKCSLEIPHIQKLIDGDKKDIVEFKAENEKGNADAANAEADIAELTSQISQAESKIKADTETKDAIQKKFAGQKLELQDTIEALDGAIAKLESTSSSFIQLPKEDQATVLAFAQGADLDSSTGDLINTLKDARDEFQNELQQGTISSQNEINSLSMSISANQGEIESCNSHISDLKVTRSNGEDTANEAKKNGAGAAASKADNEARLDSTKTWCADYKKSQEQEHRFHTKVLEEYKNAKEALTNSANFIQVSQHVEDPQGKMLIFLAGKAKQLQSKSLAQLVSKAEASGQFDKVLGMIRNMIKELKAQGGEEEKHYLYCNSLEKENAAARSRASDAVDEASEAKNTAKSAIVTGSNNLQKEMALASDNEQNWNDIKSETTSRLRDMEVESSRDDKFLKLITQFKSQLPNPTGQLGVIVQGMIDDTATGMKDRNEAISQANTDMDNAEQAYKITKAKAGPTIADWQSSITDAVADQSGAKGRLDSAQAQLQAAQKTQAEISNQCDAKPETHEAKVARYEENIQALKEALEMLN